MVEKRTRGTIINGNRITITDLMKQLNLQIGDYWEGYVVEGKTKIVIDFIVPLERRK